MWFLRDDQTDDAVAQVLDRVLGGVEGDYLNFSSRPADFTALPAPWR
jgi:hypothetical protein